MTRTGGVHDGVPEQSGKPLSSRYGIVYDG